MIAQSQPEVLVVALDGSLERSVSSLLEARGYQLRVLRRAPVQRVPATVTAALVDWDAVGDDLVRDLRSTSPDLPILLVSARSSSERARAALNLGALDLLARPLGEARVILALANAGAQRDLRTRLGAEGLDQAPAGARRRVFQGPDIVPMAKLERIAIEHALEVCGGSRSEASRRLGISQATIYRKLKAYRTEDALG